MTSNTLRPPINLQPRAKADPTSDTSRLDAISGSTPQTSRASSPSPAPRRKTPTSSKDTTSDKATVSLIRRTLCAHHTHSGTGTSGNASKPLEELLPPLTSSNDVDLQLYAFLAIIIREFVHPWYSKITPDSVFVDEIVQIVAHCTRAIEERLRKVDLENLFLDRVPQLLDAHFTAYRTSHRPLHPPPLRLSPRYAYHALHPHPALSPVPDQSIPSSIHEQERNEVVYRHALVQRALIILLPAEDLENDCLRTLVGEILGEMILGKAIAGRVCEGRLWWDGITKLVEVLQAQLLNNRAGENDKGVRRADSSNDSGVVSGPKEASALTFRRGTTPTHDQQRMFTANFAWRILQYGYVALCSLRFMITALGSSQGPALRSSKSSPINKSQVRPPYTAPLQQRRHVRQARKPPFSLLVFPTISNALDLPSRMPWLTGALQLLQWLLPSGPGLLGNVDGLLKRHIPPHLPSLLFNLRIVLFPNNTVPPASEPAATSASATRPDSSSPSAAELGADDVSSSALAARSHCARTILGALPPLLRNTYFGTNDASAQQKDLEETVLEPLGGGSGAGDPWVLRHLVYAIVECVLLEVLPELGEHDGQL
ncbi:MAG: hypothetical protein M1837_004076 [Sclerophora amabilis]|nr:MAG: hypothetical protein M1837_004076 [Sclerophora amabilis]